MQAPAPERPITGGMATEALLAHVLVAKYADFLPLYRQAQIFARQGIELDRSTLCDWVGRACWWLEPLWRLLAPARHGLDPDLRRRHPAAGARPRPGPDQDRAAVGLRGRRPALGRRAPRRRWSTSTPRTARASTRPPTWPSSRASLQVDGYSGFKSLLENRPPGAIRLAFCWAHCRRRFYEIHQATGSPLAEEALRRIGELYRIEAEVRGRPAEERRAVRQERSKPIVDALHAWLTAQLGRVSGRSNLAEAIRYALRHWHGAGAVPRGRQGRAGYQQHRAGDPADRLGAQEQPYSPARMAGPATGRSWRAWWRPRSSTGSSPWRG